MANSTHASIISKMKLIPSESGSITASVDHRGTISTVLIDDANNTLFLCTTSRKSLQRSLTTSSLTLDEMADKSQVFFLFTKFIAEMRATQSAMVEAESAVIH